MVESSFNSMKSSHIQTALLKKGSPEGLSTIEKETISMPPKNHRIQPIPEV